LSSQEDFQQIQVIKIRLKRFLLTEADMQLVVGTNFTLFEGIF